MTPATPTFFGRPTTRLVGGDSVEWFTPTELARVRGIPTRATAARRPRWSPGLSSGSCRRCDWSVSRSTSPSRCPSPGSASPPRSPGPDDRSPAPGRPSSTPTTSSGRRHRACTSAPLDHPLLDGVRGATDRAWPRLGDAEPGPFPFAPNTGTLTGFRDAVEMRYPPGEDLGPGPTTVWMRTVALLPDEERVAVPADLPARRLRQRVQPPRRSRGHRLRQPRPHDRACTATPRVTGSGCTPRPSGSRRGSGW